MKLRAYQSGDCPVLIRLFRETVHAVCAGDYAPEQLAAWAPEDIAQSDWDRSLLLHTTLVAEEGGQIIGFGDLDPATGYLDRLYVHRNHQRQGGDLLFGRRPVRRPGALGPGSGVHLRLPHRPALF